MRNATSQKVSIIIPHHNNYEILNECIQSLYKAKYDNIEIIVVDDGSEDSSPDILKKYSDKVNIFSQKNQGLAIALNLGIKINIIKKALRKFLGIQRRFTKVFSIDNKDFYDDYAHHPTEIKAVLNSVRDVYINRKIITVFQPHRYSRINLLKDEFLSSK